MDRTIGIAIGIPQPWGAELDAHRAATGDPAAAHIPAHVTLLGPTVLPVSAELDEQIDKLLCEVAAEQASFEIELRGTGTFRPITQVVFIKMAAGISECGRLAARIRTGPLERELAYPYHPHVTVAHDMPEPVLDQAYHRLAGYRARFGVAKFTRYEHRDGSWEPLRDYPLTGIGG